MGRDAFADLALDLLGGVVALEGIARVAEPTGCATVLVDAQAENCIVVAAGANGRVDPGAVPDAALTSATTLVLQHEVPQRANGALIERARRRGSRIVLNAAPFRPVDVELLRGIDVLVVNQTEAAALAPLLGWPSEPAAFARAGAAACSRLVVVVTLGREGAIACRGAELVSARPPVVEIVDTTGAGDAFAGVLAATLDGGADLRDALRRATAAGTLACTMHGAQVASPGAAAIDALLPLVTAAAE